MIVLYKGYKECKKEKKKAGRKKKRKEKTVAVKFITYSRTDERGGKDNKTYPRVQLLINKGNIVSNNLIVKNK